MFFRVYFDSLQSTSNILDDTGTCATSYDYSEYGETTRSGDTALFNEIAYTGGIYDDSSKLYYLNARYYDPAKKGMLSQIKRRYED